MHKEAYRTHVHNPYARGDSIIAKLDERQRNKNLNSIIPIVGQTGKGKTGCGISLCIMLDMNTAGQTRWYHVDEDGEIQFPKLIFHATQFIDIVNKAQKERDKNVYGMFPKNSWLLWDESGVEQDNVDWTSERAKTIKYILQTFRYLNMGLFLTLPSMKSLALSTRRLMHAYVHIIGEPQTGSGYPIRDFRVAHFNWLKDDAIQDSQKPYREVFFDESKPNRFRKVTEYMIPRPPKAVYDAYQKKKEEFTMNLYDKAEKVLDSLENEAMDSYQNKQKLDKDQLLFEIYNNRDEYLITRKAGTKFDYRLIQEQLDIPQSKAKSLAILMNQKNERGVLDHYIMELKSKQLE